LRRAAAGVIVAGAIALSTSMVGCGGVTAPGGVISVGATSIRGGGYSHRQLTRCPATDYTYVLDRNGGGGALVLEAGLRGTKPTECRVFDRLRVLLTDGSGKRLSVRYNPTNQVLAGVVVPSGVKESRFVELAWWNWCGATTDGYGLLVSSKRKRVTYRWSIGTPACITSSQPSSLRKFTRSGVGGPA